MNATSAAEIKADKINSRITARQAKIDKKGSESKEMLLSEH
jgi:hypothetical protein